MRTFTLTENAVKNLLSTYADHYLMAEEMENEVEEFDILYEDTDYIHHKACCQTAEDWMRTIGIHPDSNYVMEIICKEKERKSK